MALMTSGQQGLLKTSTGSVIKDPYYQTNSRYLTASDRDKLNSALDSGNGNLIFLNDSTLKTLQGYYDKVSGLQEAVEGTLKTSQDKIKSAQEDIQYGRVNDLGHPIGGGVGLYNAKLGEESLKTPYTSATALKKLINAAYDTGLNLTGAPVESSVEGYSNDLAQTNLDIRNQQNQQQLDYAEWEKAQKLPGAQYQLWLVNKQNQADKANAAQSINAVQDQYLTDLPTGATLPTKQAGSYSNVYHGASSSNGISGGTFTNMYQSAMKSANISDLQTQLGDLNMQIAERQNIYEQRMNAVGGETISLDVIGGKQGEIARQEQINLNYLANQKSAIVEQINSAMSMVETYMKYYQMDYQAAQDAYSAQYQQQMDMMNYMQEERSYSQQVAQANLNTIIKQVELGDFSFNDLDESTKLMINQFEAQAGLPVGFTSLVKSKNPTDEIISTTTREDGTGAKYSDVLFRNKNTGEMSTFSFYLGGVAVGGGSGGSSGRSSGGSSSSSKKQSATTPTNYWSDDASYFISQLDSKAMTWGDAWNQMKTLFPDASNSDIDNALGGGYDDVSGIWYGRAASEERKAGTTTEIADGLYQYSNAWGDYILPSY